MKASTKAAPCAAWAASACISMAMFAGLPDAHAAGGEKRARPDTAARAPARATAPADGATSRGTAHVVGAADIGGVVRGPRGPEAGVWVIAETADLPTGFAKVVVTDERGRFLIPALPPANYRVWVRGYGLADSTKVDARPGRRLALSANAAPDARAAAEIYPAMYWYSMLEIPRADEFPGTGDAGNGIGEAMRSQHHWLDTLKHSCGSCHSIGSRGFRTVPERFAREGTPFQAWARRTQSGQAMTAMMGTLGRLGAERALKHFADWTARIAAGAVPPTRPERPSGVERNLVVTMWDFSAPKHYLHDGISTYPHDPRVNANGPIYGAPEESTDLVPVLDPVRHAASTIRHPVVDPATPSSRTLPMQPSPYWGDEPIWDGHSSLHNAMMGADGRVWFSARLRPAANPAFCRAGSAHPSARVVPLAESARQLSVYDPRERRWRHLDTCFTTHHLSFARDANATLWLSQGGPQSGVVGWVDTKRFLETGDAAASQGWTPIVVDTNGNGRRDGWVGPNDPVDPARDKRVSAAFYGVVASTVDDSVWGQTMDTGFSRMDQPGYLVRLVPGPDPSNTALAELHQPPEGTFGPRGIDMDTKGVVWTTLASGHVASFDRRRCKGPLAGPTAAEGRQCPEGWTLYRMPGPQFANVGGTGSANHAYFVWVDRFGTLGLGADVPVVSANGSESLLAVVGDRVVDLRVPTPLGFFTKLVDGRIDDPAAGWKGRGVWTMSGTRAVFHNEGGTANHPKVVKFQVRPDPLAR